MEYCIHSYRKSTGETLAYIKRKRIDAGRQQLWKQTYYALAAVGLLDSRKAWRLHSEAWDWKPEFPQPSFIVGDIVIDASINA